MYRQLKFKLYDRKLEPTTYDERKLRYWLGCLVGNNTNRKAHTECSKQWNNQEEFKRLADTTLNVLVWPMEHFLHFHIPNTSRVFDNDYIKPILKKHNNKIFMYNAAYDWGWDVIVKVRGLTQFNRIQATKNISDCLEIRKYINHQLEALQFQRMSNCAAYNNIQLNYNSDLFIINEAGIIVGGEYNEIVFPNSKVQRDELINLNNLYLPTFRLNKDIAEKLDIAEKSTSECLNCCLDDIIKYWDFEDCGKIYATNIIRLFSKSCKIGEKKIEKYCKDNRHTIKQLNEQNQEGIRKYKQSKNYGTK